MEKYIKKSKRQLKGGELTEWNDGLENKQAVN